MIKRLIVSLAVSCMLYATSFVTAKAEETTCVTTTQYGGAVTYICGAKHEPVETGLADINPVILASSFFGLAGIALVKAKKLARAEVAL